MARSYRKKLHQQAVHMAAPTSPAVPFKNPLPTGSRPHMPSSVYGRVGQTTAAFLHLAEFRA